MYKMRNVCNKKGSKKTRAVVLFVLLQEILPGSNSRLCMGAYMYLYTRTGELGNKRLMWYFKQANFESLLRPFKCIMPSFKHRAHSLPT